MKRILVAAGDRALTRFIAEALLGRQIDRSNTTLNGAEWDVSRAHTALETTLLTSRAKHAFDVIIIDQTLPGHDLLVTLAELRKDPRTEDAPIFVMSERGRDQLTRRLASERFFVAGFIEKPVTVDSLRRGLKNLERTRSVLVIDSDLNRAELAQRALEAAGYDVRVTADGSGAMAAVANERPDAVVCALSLEDVPGAELCAQIKQTSEIHTIPVLLHGDISELARVEIAENAHRADDFLREPYDPGTLVQRIAPLAGRGVSRPSDAVDAPRPSRTVFDRARATLSVPPVSGKMPPPTDFEALDAGTDTKFKAIGVDYQPTEPPPGPPPRPSKRATRRVPCRVSVKIADGETIYESETLNISDGGIMIVTPHPLKIGTKIDLVFTLPESDDEITAGGKVAWLSGNDVVGLKFSRIDPEQLDLIVNYVNRMASIVYVAP